MLHRMVSRSVGAFAAAALGLGLAACEDNTTGTPPAPPVAVPAVTLSTVIAPHGGLVNTSSDTNVIVVAKNSDGSLAQDVVISFSLPNQGLITALRDTTGANGQATPGTWHFSKAAGTQRLVARGPGAADLAIDVVVSPDTFVTLTAPAGLQGGSFVAGGATSVAPTFAAVDKYGNRVGEGVPVTFTALDDPASISPNPTTAETDATGAVSPGAWTLSTLVGPQRLSQTYDVNGVPTTTITTVNSICASTALDLGGSSQGQWRDTNCRTATSRIGEYSLPAGGPAVFDLTLAGVSGQSLQVQSASGTVVQKAPPPGYLNVNPNPYALRYVLPVGAFSAWALAPNLQDNVYTLSRSGDLTEDVDFYDGDLTETVLPPIGCAKAGDVPAYAGFGINVLASQRAGCAVGGLGAVQDRYLVQLGAGDTLAATVVVWPFQTAAMPMSLYIRDANSAGGPVVATGTIAGTGTSNFETDVDFVDNETIVFVGGNAGGGNGFVAPPTGGLYEVVVGSTDPDLLYQLFIEKPIHITSTALPAATVGEDYSQVLTADGGTLSRVWSVSAGELDAGLEVNSEGGLGGVPEVAGTYTFTVSVLGGSMAQKQFTLTVNP